VPDALESVKTLASDYRKWAQDSQKSGDVLRASRQSRNADNLELVAHELEAARKRLRPIPKEYGDLSDLPEEVMAQLSLTKIDELEQQLRDIIASAKGDEIGLDSIIIELYRRHKVVHERRFIMNKLYRMGQKGIIQSVEGKKGAYYLAQPATASASASIFDTELDDDVPF
jgi:hypothetical protein